MKRYLIIIAIAFLLIGIYIQQEFKTPPKSQSAGYTPIFTDVFSESNVWKIHFYPGNKQDMGVQIERNKTDTDRWNVISYFNGIGKKADIERLLKDLKEMEGEERGMDSSLFPDFNIGEEDSYHLVISGREGNDLYHLVIGKKGPDYSNGFVRFKDKNTVYLTDKNIRSYFGIYGEGNDQEPDQKRWVDMSIISLSKDEITAITMKQGKKEIKFSKREKVIETKKTQNENEGDNAGKAEGKTEIEWIISGSSKEPIPKDKTESLISSISRLSGADLVDPKKIEEYGLTNPETTLLVSMKNGKEHILFIGTSRKDDNKKYYIKRKEEDTIFLLADYVHKNIFEKILEISGNKN